MRPRRSVLYMPGSNRRALEKARTLAADSLILDLEDAVSPEAKEIARRQVTKAVTEGGYGDREVVVRVNGLDTPWGRDDVAAIGGAGADAILFPKVASPEDVLAAIEMFDEVGAPSDLPVWIMAETPRCVLEANAIAGAHRRLAVIVMGTSDLAKEMRVRHTPGREGLLGALTQCVLAARAHALDILDGVYLDLDDEQGFRASCIQGRDMGFDGKTLIHPKQVGPANEAFAPTEAELARARKIMSAWGQAQNEGRGVVVVDGRLVENLHVEEARRMLELDARIAGSGQG